MPNLQTSIKDLRQSRRKAIINDRTRGRVKRAVKKFDTLVAEGKKKDATKTLSQVSKVLDKAAKSGVIKKNSASRKKSRLARKLNKLTAKNVKTAKKGS
jgi:small subunit ribosomal protein S20